MPPMILVSDVAGSISIGEKEKYFHKHIKKTLISECFKFFCV